MKKLLCILFLAVFLISGFEAAAANTSFQNQNLPARNYTHTVLAEEGTATTCGYCPTAARQLHELYTSGDYNFFYVTLVCNKNPYASGRASELGISGYPTIVFDGGYRRVIGMQQTSGPYASMIEQCGARTVANLAIDLQISWEGTGQIGVSATVTNNEATSFNGHLHVYVTEINSRWWNGAVQYHFAMVGDYAINQDITIDAEGNYQKQTVWNGDTYNVGDIAQNNVMVIASVFKAGLLYAEETEAASFSSGDNQPPTTPTITGEENGTIRTAYDYTIRSTDPEHDDIKYVIDWGDDSTTTTGYNYSGAEVSVSYMWKQKGSYTMKVKAIDDKDAESEWATLEVVMPAASSYAWNHYYLERFFEKFPNVFPIIRSYLGF